MKPAKNIEQSIKNLTVESSKQIHERILDELARKLDAREGQAVVGQAHIYRIFTTGNAIKLAAACLIVSLGVTCFFLSRRVTNLEGQLEQARRDVDHPQADDSATIHLYLKEHQETVARHVSLSSHEPESTHIRVRQDDILYYELLDDQLETMSPGIIVRGPLSQGQTVSPKSPAISNGHALSFSEAKESSSFDLVAPPWLDPGFALDKIRSIEGRDAMQLLYTNGIDTVSLFEQPLDGRNGLTRQDFREYAVYNDAEHTGGNILAWRGNVRSYVLVGNSELSQLMGMAQSISAGE